MRAKVAEANGLMVVMNRCPKIEYGRLSSEISWMGVNTRTLTSKRAKILGGGIQRMGDQAYQEYRGTIEAYVAGDASRAAAIADMDELLDQIHREFIQQIFETHAAQSLDLQVAVQLALIARFYERLGDHAVNIAKRVVYIATGAIPEHEASGRPRPDDSGDGARQGGTEHPGDPGRG